MPKRFTVVIPDPINDLLEVYAEKADKKPATFAADLLEESLKKIDKETKFDVAKLSSLFVLAVANGGSIDLFQLQQLADELKIPSDRLAEVYAQMRRKKDGIFEDVSC